MKKIRLSLISFFILFICLAKPSFAITVFEDSFTDMSKIDQAKTTAFVDTTAGEITLPRAKMPNAVAVDKTRNEYAVINGDEINFYDFDAATNTMTKNNLLTVQGITDPVGIAMGQDDYSTWVITKGELRRYDFTGSGMSNNPYLSVTGLTDVFSVSVNPVDDSVVVLSKDSSKKGVVTTFKQTEEGKLEKVPQLSFSTDIEDPTSLSIAPDTGDIVVAGGNSLTYYSFDDSKSTYTKNIIMSVDTGKPVVSVSMQNTKNGYVSLGANTTDYYMYDVELSKISRVPTLSASLQGNYNYSVSLKPNAYEYAILDENGTVEYWSLDDSTNQMKRNSMMEVSGITIKNRYDSPRDYVSTNLTVGKNFDQVKITSQEEKQSSDTITWSVSEDDGATWNEIQTNQWTDVSISSKICVKATLKAAENANQPPPKILDVKVEVTLSGISDIKCIGITDNFPEQTLPTSSFPVKAKKGSQVVYEVDTTGFIESLSVKYSTGETKELAAQSSVDSEDNKWVGAITFEPNEQEGKIIGVALEGVRKGKKFESKIDNFININQYVIFDTGIKLTR